MAITANDVQRLIDAKDDYWDNADYRETNSTTKALAFQTAVTRLLGILPDRVSHGGIGAEDIRFNLEVLQKERDEVRDFVKGRQRSGGKRFFSLRCAGR